MTDETLQMARNLAGKELESKNHIDAAIALYEANVSEGFNGNHPYDRLSVIYRKHGLIIEEIRVLEKAISVFENLDRGDAPTKLEKFKARLEKAKTLLKN